MSILHRLFFAILPPAIERARIGLTRDLLDAPIDPVANARLHLTLAITGDYPAFPDAVAERMLAIGGQVAADPFELVLERLSGSSRSVALRPAARCHGLGEVQRQLARDMAYWSLGREGWSFSPHVTLGYRQGDPFLMPITPIAWEVTEFALIHSRVGATEHIALGRWPLEAAQQEFAGF